MTPVVSSDIHADVSPINACEQVVAAWIGKPEIQHGGTQTCYWPRFDKVNMPERKTFDPAEFYYSVMFHELGQTPLIPASLIIALERSPGTPTVSDECQNP